jgi:hypothetical protein
MSDLEVSFDFYYDRKLSRTTAKNVKVTGTI